MHVPRGLRDASNEANLVGTEPKGGNNNIAVIIMFSSAARQKSFGERAHHAVDLGRLFDPNRAHQ
jgi:hypothetical protein